jgi:hypothetical protein
MVNALKQQMSAGQIVSAFFTLATFVAGYFGVIIAVFDILGSRGERQALGVVSALLIAQSFRMLRREHIIP